jgi:hypothetical protein
MNRNMPLWTRLARVLFVLGVLFASAALPWRAARADIAPPEQPPGGSLAPGSESTPVVMQSEQVILTVQPEPWSGTLSAEEENRGVTRDWAQVEAHFVMRNAGPQTESMTVRFPLSAPLSSEVPASEIQSITVHLNGRVAETRHIQAPLPSQDGGGEAAIIGWAAFDVDFPPGREVRIDVSYPLRATGYANQDSRFVYVLGTGAGWSGAIGRAEIILKLPYPASRENIVEYDSTWISPGYKIAGNQITWRYDDLEPTADQVVVATLVAQDLWEAVLQAEPAVSARPEDGGAWGALARALKIAVCTEKGYWPRQDVGGTLLVERSIAAYERATSFSPHEARWHAGYAELLIKVAQRDDATDPLLRRAVEHLNLALVIEPTNEQALQVLEDLRSSPVVEVDQTDAGPHIILRAAPPTAPATATAQLTAPTLPPTASATRASSGLTQTATPAALPTASGSAGRCAGQVVAVSLAAPLVVLLGRRSRSTRHPPVLPSGRKHP